MNIGEAADHSGIPTKTIRYYEEIGLIRPALRAANNYRHYDETRIRTLQFLKRARSLGFTIEECRELSSLYQDRSRSSADVKRIAQTRVDHINQKITELQSMRNTLEHLIADCHGDDLPDCPILDDLAKL